MVSRELMNIGASDIYMTERSRYRKEDFSYNEQKVKVVSYNDRYLYIQKCNIVIGATSSPHYTVTCDMLEDRIGMKAAGRYVFIDLAVPRDFDESICQIEGVSLYNIDDLKKLTSVKSTSTKQLDLKYIHEQINCHAADFLRWFKYKKAFSCYGEV